MTESTGSVDHAGWRIPAQAALFLGIVANGAVPAFLFLVFPAIGRRVGFTDMQTGAVLSAAALAVMLAAPAWGYLSDRVGRRPVLLLGIAGATLGPFAYGLIVGSLIGGTLSIASALALFFVARVGQAMLSAGVVPAAQAYVADLTVPEDRVRGMGLIGAAAALASVIAAMLAWRISGSDGIKAFAVLSALALVALAGALLLVKEPPRRSARATDGDGRFPLVRIWPFVSITVLGFCVYSILKQVMTLHLQDTFGFTPDESIAKAGAALTGTAVAMIITQGVALRFLSLRPEILLSVGALLATIAMLLCSLARTDTELVVTLALFGVALGCMLPGNLASISLRSGSHAQARAAGINVIGQGLGLAIGPLAGASLYQISAHTPFVAATMLLMLCVALAMLGARRSAS